MNDVQTIELHPGHDVVAGETGMAESSHIEKRDAAITQSSLHSLYRDPADVRTILSMAATGTLLSLLLKYTARHFRHIYRLDLADPRLSDRWNFVPACKGDAELSYEIASIVVGFDFNKHYNGDPFWPQAETALMTSLLLHLPQIAHNPSPAMIAEFIAARGFDEINHEMKESPDLEAQVQWGIFKKADREKEKPGVRAGCRDRSCAP
jgi:hypothetical protein